MLTDTSTPSQREALHLAEACVLGHEFAAVPRFHPDGTTSIEIRGVGHEAAFQAVRDIAKAWGFPKPAALGDAQDRYGSSLDGTTVWTCAR